MNMPFYVAPEQLMKDRADFAQKGIARGRSLVAIEFDEGILLCAENPSRNLRKVSEIYDRIGFAGVGRYNEYDQLRIAGIRHADLKGYTYSRDDVDSQALANQYAQMLGQIFTHETKPLEVEILVVAVGYQRQGDRLFHIRFDGSVTDEQGYAVLGGEAESIRERLGSSYNDGLDNAGAMQAAVGSLQGDDRTLGADELEVAVLERKEDGRCFRRLDPEEIAQLLA
ncbi:MAG: proteasome subunit alpha [Actinomycetia bacterium]|nr:proteasome subunit alpha [Actinomycetes bacterium]MCP5033464.1 proteasome subunit alpha [Actinomycetes bacterium]